MRMMSFALTTQAVRDEIKDVTRRLGWADLKPGDRLQAVVKCQGIPRGGHVEKLKVIEVVSNWLEPLCAIGGDEMRREGFPEMTADDFVDMFIRHMPRDHEGRPTGPHTPVNRIEFQYVHEEATP